MPQNFTYFAPVSHDKPGLDPSRQLWEMACRSNLGRGVSTWSVRGRSRFPPLRPLLNHRQSGPPERGGNPQNRKHPAKAFCVGPSGRPAPCCGVGSTGREKMQLTPRLFGSRSVCRHLKATGCGHHAGTRNVAADSRFPLRNRVSLGIRRTLAKFATGRVRAVQHTSSEYFFRIKGEPNFTNSSQS